MRTMKMYLGRDYIVLEILSEKGYSAPTYALPGIDNLLNVMYVLNYIYIYLYVIR